MPHANDQDTEHWESIIGDMVERSTATAQTQPGIYRMPCGACYVDFYITADGEEHWLVPGDPQFRSTKSWRVWSTGSPLTATVRTMSRSPG